MYFIWTLNFSQSYLSLYLELTELAGFFYWTLYSQNSQFINLIGQCIAIELTALPTTKGRLVFRLGNDYTFPFFFPGLVAARPLPPYSFNEKPENGRKSKNDSRCEKRESEEKECRTPGWDGAILSHFNVSPDASQIASGDFRGAIPCRSKLA